MGKKIKHKKDQDNRAEYVPPQVMRLEDIHTGRGACDTGTGDPGDCGNCGYQAGGGCLPLGYSAGISCLTGNGFVGGSCLEPGEMPGGG